MAFVTTSSLTRGIPVGIGGVKLAARGTDSAETDVLRLFRQSVRMDLTGFRLAPCWLGAAAAAGKVLTAGEN